MSGWFWFAGACTATAMVISFRSIMAHLQHYRRPDIQRLIIRILFMPVVYSFTSWLSFGSSAASHWLDPIRDGYEAFALWVFFQLMMTYMGGEREFLSHMDDGRLPSLHLFPFHWCLNPMDFSNPRTFVVLKRGILQFVLVKPLLTVLTILLKWAGVYEEGEIHADSGYIYLSVLYNISIFISMYCLVLFYTATAHDLAEHQPMAKFLCIKAVVFFTFWQSFIISILVKVGVIHDTDWQSASRTATAIQNFLICMEMVIASIAHRYAFTESEYRHLESARLPLSSAIKDAIGFNDLLLEMKHTIRGTNFIQYDDLLEQSGARRPLLSSRYARTSTDLEFQEEDAEIEKLFQDVRSLPDGDYGYRVISPPITSGSHPTR